MPALVLTGHPCTGKTTFARLLGSRALSHPSGTVAAVVHVCESTACPDQTKAECYSSSQGEKATRAALKSEFDRAVVASASSSGDAGNDTLVILDSLNYIKGYRYELYCISKAAGERHGVVWIEGDGSSADGEGGRARTTGTCGPGDELAKRRNEERKGLHLQLQQNCNNDQSTNALDSDEMELDGYYEDDATMDELVLRFEPPDDKNRWENPLYRVNMTHILPWGKDGTKQPKTNEIGAEKSLTSQVEAIKVDDRPRKLAVQPTTAAKKSSSGFKRRSKKSTQQASANRSAQSTTSTVVAPEAASSVPSSMASRNLSSNASNGQDQTNTNGSKQKIENVIDAILDSFLMNVAPLKEGMSTMKHSSAESNVLNQVDSVTQRTNGEILKAQKAASLAAGVGGRIYIPLSNGSEGDRRALSLTEPLYPNELRDFRRQFLKWITGHPMEDGAREEEIAAAYVSYIETRI